MFGIPDGVSLPRDMAFAVNKVEGQVNIADQRGDIGFAASAEDARGCFNGDLLQYQFGRLDELTSDPDQLLRALS